MTRRWSETRLHDGSDNPPVTEGRVRFIIDDGRDAATLAADQWKDIMAYQVELPPAPLIEEWQLHHTGGWRDQSAYSYKRAAEDVCARMSNPDEWRIVHMREVRE